MNDDAKRFVLDSLRKTYQDFLQEIVKVPGSAVHKQQALFRFEEAYMWMQNAVVSFIQPAQPHPQPEVPPEIKIEGIEDAKTEEPQAVL